MRRLSLRGKLMYNLKLLPAQRRRSFYLTNSSIELDITGRRDLKRLESVYGMVHTARRISDVTRSLISRYVRLQCSVHKKWFCDSMKYVPCPSKTSRIFLAQHRDMPATIEHFAGAFLVELLLTTM